MTAFSERLQHGRVPMILDGALATELEQRGHDISGPLWSARLLRDAPEAIEQLHLDYFVAGAQCVITSSYQASYEGFAALGLSRDETTTLLERSVSLARDARDQFAVERRPDASEWEGYVAASIGPFGATRHDGSEYRGDYGLSVAELVKFHAPRFDLLAGSGADVLACETIPSLDEVRALAELLRAHPATEAWVSLTSHDGRHTAHGEPLGDLARLLDDVANVVAVGVNCLHPALVLTAIRELRRRTGKPIVVYPNDGSRWNAERRQWQGVPEDLFVELAPAWVEAGARLIGGCCRIGPEKIAELARAFRG
jgi:homocysteine S-methyltransferase